MKVLNSQYVRIKDVSKIEKQNSIRISVFGHSCGKNFFPIYVSSEKYEDHMELLLISNEVGSHYVLIKDFGRMIRGATKHNEKKHPCMHCLQCFTPTRILEKHKKDCIEVNGKQTVTMPKKDSFVELKNYHRQLPVPFTIYADFEAILEKTDSDKPKDHESYTYKYQNHVGCGYGYKVVCHFDDGYSRLYKSYRGENSVNHFIKSMLEEVKLCNVNFTLTNKIPVIFHNLSGYDSHLIMQEIGKFNMQKSVIPNNMEKYMAFTLGKQLVFIDSIKFMNSSLANLANYLPDESFHYVSQEFEGDRLDMVKQKGVYPYEYMDSFDKLEDKSLPDKTEFYNTRNNTNISNQDYTRAKRVWETFGMKNMGDNHDLYLKTDVLILADVFENFRKECLKHYKLDPCHYFSSPGLSWDSMLKITGVKLELMTDVDMFQFIERGMRGGVSYISHRHAKANNKYMESYNPEKPDKHIMYLDANNLYGWAMSQNLPTGGFRWITVKKKIELERVAENIGLILEVDLEYPKELHDLHNGYPLAPEKMTITEDMLSWYCNEIKDKFNLTVGNVQKLVTTLSGKKNYVGHYKNLIL
jgi:hypothetical protein